MGEHGTKRGKTDEEKTERYRSICFSLAKAYTIMVRLYQEKTLIYSYAPYPIEPDPLLPYLHRIPDSGQKMGIITTSLGQFYGFLYVTSKLCIVLGPTCVLKEDEAETDKFMKALKITPDDRENYRRTLYSAPIIHVDRFAWLLVSMATMIRRRSFTINEVWMDTESENIRQSVRQEYDGSRVNNLEDMGISHAVKQSLYWERLVTSYVRKGQTKLLKEVFDAPPKVYAGNMDPDEFRQMKNKGISMAVFASRAVIEGGLDPQQAFLKEDYYIRKLELLQDLSSMDQLLKEMLLDFAEQVEKLRCPVDDKSTFCRKCVLYVSQNIFSSINIENMAKELGYSRSYLCSHFKKKMGVSLTQYIQQEKVEEAKHLLQFSEHNLSEIASMLNFSSQSHFQTVFKKITGETPLSYRRSVKL